MYSFHHKRLTWNSSREWCQNKGGDLVSIETDKERNYLTDVMVKSVGSYSNSKQAGFYIGLSKGKTRSWYWLSNNKTVPDRGWRWQVNISAAGDCAAMLEYYQDKKGYFIDLLCSLRSTGENKNLSSSSRGKEEVDRGFICEKFVGKSRN